MPRKKLSIPVNSMLDLYGRSISIEKLNLGTLDGATLKHFEGGNESHRHDAHTFFLLESGTVRLDIDFQHHTITAPAILYVHPNQVHQTLASADVIVSSLAMADESLNAAYLELLDHLSPAKPLALEKETFAMISEAVSLCLKFAERKKDKLYHFRLKDSCNALVALVLSLYLESTRSLDSPSRSDEITKTFREILESDFTKDKRPTAYAQKLNISTSYLNECVKTATGYTVSHHIQQRVVLEAKRLLHYSDKSVKEIAMALGYEDYPYFSRFFVKNTGMTALDFRRKTLD
ncbi:AraC family transcriptional regulator [Pedobacter sp. MC2016-24]|uniref:AraC family transcriptional regulator n=1 Tax=Pedobacter sp. MC2016-24 TaxID=2780090 RepID=UPI001881F34F|nr:AraC family transcriptional regulator [Pedobacter sp. MC2016-24]MBE9601851.1 helix-turn-helix domain-containing protein [Pedobacter sp. MC2016-24]